LGTELGRVADSFSGVYIVVERGDGSLSRPYDGEIIDCKDEVVTPEFKQAFKDAWWGARRPALGPAPFVNRRGTRAPSATGGERRSAGDGPSAVAASHGVGHGRAPVAGVDGCPPFALHPPAVLLRAKTKGMGQRILTLKMVSNMLQSLGLSSINQITTARVRSVFRSISGAVTPPGKGRIQWTWPQTCPIDLLFNMWEVEAVEKADKKVMVHAACLYPPWHNVIKAGFEERRLAVILAASLDDFWLYHLCKELNVQWMPDLRSSLGCTKAAEAALAPLTKKRGHSPNKGTNKSNKKQRGAKDGEDATEIDSAAAAETGGSTAGTGGSAADAGRLPLVARCSTGDPSSRTDSTRLLVDVLREADGSTLRGLADAVEVPTFRMESTTIENASVGEEERVAASLESQTMSLLLPFDTVVDCMKFYSGNAIDDGSPTASDAILKVSSVSIPTTTITRTALTNMLSVHSYNKDVAMLRETFTWLGHLSVSMDFFPPGLGPIFSPRMSVAALAAEVHEWLSASRVADDAWRFFDEASGADGAEAGSRLYGGQTVTIREVASCCGTSWLTSDTINAAIIELRLASRHAKGYALLTGQMASLLRIDGKQVTLEAAKVAAAEVADEVGDSRWLGMVINLCNAHWVSAFVDLEGREVFVYDSLPGTRDAELEVAVQRVILLCNTVMDKRSVALAPPFVHRGGRTWRETRCVGPTQPDSVSCGLFALAHVLCSFSGVPFAAACPRADLLRLALVHHILSRGRHYASARVTWSDAS